MLFAEVMSWPRVSYYYNKSKLTAAKQTQKFWRISHSISSSTWRHY